MQEPSATQPDADVLALRPNLSLEGADAAAQECEAMRWVRRTQYGAAASVGGLVVLSLLWELWLVPLRFPACVLVAVIKVLPLLIPLRGILRKRMYTYRWVSLLVWLYFTEGVVRGWSDRPPGNWLGWLEVLLCLCLFVACAGHVKARFRHACAMEQTASARAAQTGTVRC